MEQSLLFAAKMSSILGEKGFLRERTIKSRLETPAASKTLKKTECPEKGICLIMLDNAGWWFYCFKWQTNAQGSNNVAGEIKCGNVDVEHQILVEYLIFCSVLIKLGNSDKLTFPKQILNIRGLGKSSGWRWGPSATSGTPLVRE